MCQSPVQLFTHRCVVYTQKYTQTHKQMKKYKYIHTYTHTKTHTQTLLRVRKGKKKSQGKNCVYPRHDDSVYCSPFDLCQRQRSLMISSKPCCTTLIHLLSLCLSASNPVCVPRRMRQSMAAFRATPGTRQREDVHAAAARAGSGAPLPPIVHNPRLHPPHVHMPSLQKEASPLMIYDNSRYT
jgi:hypothetical protein